MLDLNNLSEDLVNKKDEEFYLYWRDKFVI
jgi:hypothetical protein